MTDTIPNNVRYDPSALLGSPSPFNMVVGGRSIGKTYSIVKRAVRNWIRDGSQWVYVRRYDTDLKAMLTAGDFFQFHEQNNEFPGYTLRTRGRLMEIKATEGKDKWHTLGLFLAISKGQNYKSTPLPNVTIMFYDEFIAETGRYIPGEPDKLIGLWETIDRRQNRVRVYMAANAADIINPYFVEWQLTLPPKGKVKTYRHNRSSITIQYADDTEFKKAAEQTTIGRFTAGSNYERYALENEFTDDTETAIGRKPSTARYRCTLIFNDQEFGIWFDPQEGEWYVNHQNPDDDSQETYTLMRRDMRPNTIMLDRADPILKILKRAVMQQFISFDTVRTREQFMRSMRMIGLR